MSRQLITRKSVRWQRIITIVLAIAVLICFIQVDSILQYFANWFKIIVEIPRLFYCIIATTTVIAIAHFILVPNDSIAKEHLLYKRLGPILSIPLTCISHGVFIYCGLQLIYIVYFDKYIATKYPNLDRSVVAVTMITLMVYSVWSLKLIAEDVVMPTDKEGILIEGEEAAVERDSENVTNSEES